jgi:hypothetical protein
MAIRCRGVHKPVEIFFDIDRIEEQAFRGGHPSL